MLGSDIFIMIPIECKDITKVKSINYNGDIECNQFYSELDNQIKYACNKK